MDGDAHGADGDVPGRWADLSRPPLGQSALRRALTSGEHPAWRALEVVAETGSTNADLAERARQGEPGGLVRVAEAQTAGRGRRDRSWTAPPRSALTFSVLLRPSAPLEHWSWLGLLAAVAITDALQQDCGLAARVKWPNDVLLPPVPLPGADPDDLRKVAGLLSEVVATADGPAVIIGIGINVTQDAAELPVATATSLRLAGSARTDRDPILRSVLRHLAQRWAGWEASAGDPRAGLAAAYRERCDTIGRAIRVHLPASGSWPASPEPDGSASAGLHGRVLDGVADGVDDEGRLLVRDTGNGAITALSVGDVVHIRPPEPA